MVASRLTRAQLERVVASVRGLRITGVAYALRSGADDLGTGPSTWDHGAWHGPARGCRLATDVGAFTFAWGDTLGCGGLEAGFDQSADELIDEAGDPWGATVVSVGDHPRWRHLLGREIVDTELAWIEWVSGGATPCWIRLELAAGQPDGEPEPVWIAAGRWERGRFLVATDDVTVLFARSEALRAGITK